MSPILGIMASSFRAAAGDFESIATVTVGSGGAADAVFSSIPGTYAHLQIRAIGRTNRGSGATNDPFKIVFNSDTGNNYSQHYLTGDGSTATSEGYANQGFISAYLASASGATASVFGATIVDILDYANTNKHKTTRALGGFDNNGSGIVALVSGNWRNTNAITTITLTPQVGSNWQQYSHFALYGIKSA